MLSLKDGEMTNRMVEAEYGVEIEDLRLVPLPDGRVVMSTGDGAEFFDLSTGLDELDHRSSSLSRRRWPT